MSNKVTVIMSIYNETLDELTKSINSIINQTYSNIEFIIVNDNPDRLELTDFIDSLNKKNNIIFLQNQKNIGLARSLNKCIEKSSGIYIARMDADDISKENRIEEQVDYLIKNQDVDLLSTRCYFINSQDEITGENSKIPEKNRLNKLYIQNFLIHPSWMIKRNTIIEMNGYRNFSSSQDYDFVLRLIDRGGVIDIIDNPLILYRVRDNSISNSKGLEQYLISKYIKYLSKERAEKGEDSFSTEGMKNRIKYSKREAENFYKCQKSYSRKKIKFIFYLIKSKYYRFLIWDKIKFKLA